VPETQAEEPSRSHGQKGLIDVITNPLRIELRVEKRGQPRRSVWREPNEKPEEKDSRKAQKSQVHQGCPSDKVHAQGHGGHDGHGPYVGLQKN
jgi:hypothetical protein